MRMSDTQRYKALVAADCIIVPNAEFTSADQAEGWLKQRIDTGDLGPVEVKAVEPDE